MATLTPSHRAASKPPPLEREDLAKALKPWRRRITLLQVIHWLVGSIILGLGLACLIFLVSRMVPWATAPYWAVAIGMACPMIAALAALWYRPSIMRTASLVDRELHLHDRMRTAWELCEQGRDMGGEEPPFRGRCSGEDVSRRGVGLSPPASSCQMPWAGTSPRPYDNQIPTLERDKPQDKDIGGDKLYPYMAGLQHRDALKQLQQYTPVASLPIRFRRSTPVLMLVGSVILALLIILPNPMTDYLRQQADLQAKITKQISSIEQLRHSIDQQANLPQSEKKQIDQIINDLEAKLKNAKSETEAQQALADAQTKLDQLRDPQATNKIQAQNAAAQSLQKGQGQATASTLKAIGQALANNDSKALQQALQDLANQASQLNSEQRSQLAQDVAKAANEASQNPALSSALQQLSKALADGSASEISDATKAVEAAANQTSNMQNSENVLKNASQSLQNAANNLASSSDNPSPNAPTQQGQQQNGQGQNGQQGQGQGQSQGGHGKSGGNDGAGNKPGSNEQVYVPGQTGQGNSQQNIDNNTGIVQSGNQVSYQQVIEQYNQMAHNAIDNTNVPPDLKDLVHGYFNTLEGHQ